MTDKKNEIIKLATEMFAEGGLSVTSEEIAARARIPYGEYQKIFSSRQELVDEIFFALREEIANILVSALDLDLDTKELLHQIWRIYMKWAMNNPYKNRLIAALKISNVMSRDVYLATEHFFVAIQETFKEGIAKGEIKDMPIDLLTEMGISAMRGGLAYIWGRDNLSPREAEILVDQCFESFYQGIRK